ncbi:MAG: hypothetical protein AB7G37_05040 [Solirubrobacteraceae bacterium]
MTDFVQAVANASGLPTDTVRSTLSAHAVHSYTPRGRPAKLRLSHLAFTGFKDPDEDEPVKSFSFEWTFQPGLQALASVGNSAGKTSVLGVCHWLLTGSGSGIDARVRPMLRTARLDLLLDDQSITVEVTDAAGTGAGSLHVGDEQIGFATDTMADVIGALMMDRLRLPATQTFMTPNGSTRGTTAEHGWPLYSGALRVAPTQLDALIGSVKTEAGRVLQVYMALPWFETLQQARTARGGITQQAGDAQKAAEAEEAARGEHTARIEQQLAATEAELARMPDASSTATALRNAAAETDSAHRAIAELERRITAATGKADVARRVQLEAQRDAVAAAEHRQASTYFRALQPHSCPRCDEPIDADRLTAESDEHACSVCTRVHEPSIDEGAIARAEEAAEVAKAAAESAFAQLSDLRSELSEQERARDDASARVASLAREQDSGTRQAKVVEIARLRGRLDERAETRTIAATSPSDDPTVKILEAATAVAKKLVEAQDDLLRALDKRILSLGQRFGVEELTGVKLGRNAHLPVHKGRTRVNFGGLSEGDRLRLKVALVIALLEVAGDHNAGQHPGLILVDSPGAQEVGAGPLAEMLTALKEVGEQQEIQVIVATARRDEAVATIGADRVRQPKVDEDKLW